MNTYNLDISSGTSEYIFKYPTIQFDDYTKLTIDPSSLSETFIPLYIRIDWGDGEVDYYDNDIYTVDRNNLNLFKKSPILRDTYSHEYTPSSTTLYKNLTAQVYLSYTNGDTTWISIPIRVRTGGYFESIYDLTLMNTNILPLSTNIKQHQFISGAGGYTLELKG